MEILAKISHFFVRQLLNTFLKSLENDFKNVYSQKPSKVCLNTWYFMNVSEDTKLGNLQLGKIIPLDAVL